MQNKRKSLIWILVVPLFCLVFPFLVAPKEPEYQGRTLTRWIDDYNRSCVEIDILSPSRPKLQKAPLSAADQAELLQAKVRRKQAESAVRHLGTNALSFLMRRLRYEPSRLEKCWDYVYSRLYRRTISPGLERHLQCADQSVLAFKILSDDATPAIPELRRLAFNGANARVSSRATAAVANSGTNGFRVLMELVESPFPSVRRNAIEEVQAQGTNSGAAVPILVRTLKDNDLSVRLAAVQAIGTLGYEQDSAIQALVGCVQDPDPRVREYALFAIGKYGDRGTSVAPAIARALTDQNASVREAASNVLQSIALGRPSRKAVNP